MLAWLSPTNLLNRLSEPEPPSIGVAEPKGSPHAILLCGTTKEAYRALGWKTWHLSAFPFYLGRATRKRRSGRPCDLYLVDAQPYTVSRSHCSLLWVTSVRTFFVQDTESKLGTIVNGLHIGPRTSRKTAPLRRGDNEIILGPSESPYKLLLRLPKSIA